MEELELQMSLHKCHTAGKDYKPDDTVTVSHLFMANTEVDLGPEAARSRFSNHL